MSFPKAHREPTPERTPLRVVGAGGKGSLDEIYTAERLHMVRLALLMVDDLPTAEDVVQDAFSAVVRVWPELLDDGAVRAYLRTCVLNAARSVLRRRRTVRTHIPPLQPIQIGADDSAVLAEERREVIMALGHLPPRQREVLVLRYWSGLSEAELSRTLGVSQGTVKSSVSRGLAALRAALTGGHRG